MQSLFRAFVLRLAPEFPPGSGQPIDWFLAADILRKRPNNGVILATSNLAIATALFLKERGSVSMNVWGALVGVADRLQTMSHDLRKKMVAKYSMADRLLVWGPAEKIFLQSTGLAQVELLPFGVDTFFWKPAQVELGDYVLSVGSDPLRDFDTLAAASPFPLRIVSSQVRIRTHLSTSRITVEDPDCAGLRSLYCEARVIAIVTKDAMQPSGQITALQSMACGRPVILTRTRSIWSDRLVSGENCLIVPAGDMQALHEAIRFLWDHPAESAAMGAAARATVLAHYPFEVLGSALASPLLEKAETKHVER